MFLDFDCPKCLVSNRQSIEHRAETLKCTACNWDRSIPAASWGERSPRNCVACGCEDLWRQKDFPPLLGVGIVALGIVLSTWAIAIMQPVWSLAILAGFGALDMILFSIMPDRLVCYRCHACYRNLPTESHSKFDLEIHERYRQEHLRTEQMKTGTAEPAPP